MTEVNKEIRTRKTSNKLLLHFNIFLKYFTIGKISKIDIPITASGLKKKLNININTTITIFDLFFSPLIKYRIMIKYANKKVKIAEDVKVILGTYQHKIKRDKARKQLFKIGLTEFKAGGTKLRAIITIPT